MMFLFVCFWGFIIVQLYNFICLFVWPKLKCLFFLTAEREKGGKLPHIIFIFKWDWILEKGCVYVCTGSI